MAADSGIVDNQSARPPLFRPEAMGEPEYGEALAFQVPSWRSFVWLGAIALILFFGFGFLAQFNRMTQARGTIAPVSGVSRLVAPQAGIVTQVYVHLGQQVAKGSPILRIGSLEGLPSGTAAEAQALATFRRQQTLTREQGAIDLQRRQDEQQRVEEQAAQLETALVSSRDQIALQQQRVATNEERLRKLGPLHDKGYISDAIYLAVQDSVLSGRQQLASLRESAAQAEHDLNGTKLRIAELAAERRGAELQSQGSLLELERGAVGAQARAEVVVAAPSAGVVGALAVAPGGIVNAGQQLAGIFRAGDPIEAILNVPSSSIGLLRAGQKVTLRYDAFPYQRYGLGHGIVSEVSSSAIAERFGAEPAYRVKVRLLDSARFPLRPDMNLTASIVTEHRSLLDWLFAPLKEKWRERQSGDVG